VSQENVEVVRRAHAEFERGNFWVPEFFDAGVRVVWLSAIGVEDQTVGLPGMSRVMIDWMQSWEQVSLVAERFIDAGDQVVVIGDWRGRGKASGVVSNWRHGAVWTLRDGKVISLVSYSDPADALKAVGLEQ
jgi:ketosteroid isomerase-like protein